MQVTISFPKYRVGQRIAFRNDGVVEVVANERIEAMVLYPRSDGSYLVKLWPNGGYAIILEAQVEEVLASDPVVGREGVGVLFMGNGRLALAVLSRLVELGYDIAAVVTRPDRRQGRGMKVSQSEVKRYAAARNIPVLQPWSLTDPVFLLQAEALKPTIGVVAEFRILPQVLYDIPVFGTLCMHTSLLPQYKGATPVQCAIRDGCALTGVTVFKVREGADSGDVAVNLGVPVAKDDTSLTLGAKMTAVGPAMVDDAIRHVVAGCPLTPQSDIANDFLAPSYAHKLVKADVSVPWHCTAWQVRCWVRAYCDVPVAYSLWSFNGQSKVAVQVRKVSFSREPRGERKPGTLFVDGKRVLVACADYCVSLDELRLPGRKTMTAQEFVNGFHGQCVGRWCP